MLFTSHVLFVDSLYLYCAIINTCPFFVLLSSFFFVTVFVTEFVILQHISSFHCFGVIDVFALTSISAFIAPC